MALYRQGEASMSAEGVITGDGTQWRQPLSFIRKGATIVFLTTPLKLAVINTIDSDTEMTAITTDGDEVPQSKYVILLNDSLTVDGMAQDVAETLRYYQSKETEIADAIEFFRDFDLQGLKDLVSSIEQAVQDTDQAKLAAEAAKTGAETARDNANQIKSDTQSIKDSAIQEVGQIKTDAEAAKTSAETARDTAQGYVTDAETAKTDAETARDQAEIFAQSVNPDNLLHKDQNLSDVIDKALARGALDVPAKSEAFMISNNFSEIADRATAWLNIRPIGATPLGGDPVNDFDAVTKRWVMNLAGTGSTSWNVNDDDAEMPTPGAWVNGGFVRSAYRVNANDVAVSSMYTSFAVDSGGYRNAKINFSIDNKNGESYTLSISESGVISSSGGEFNFGHLIRSSQDVIAGSGKAVRCTAGEANEIYMQSSPSGQAAGAYINYLQGKWYNGLWTFGGVRGSSTLLQRVQLNVNNGGSDSASYIFNPNGVGQAAQWQNTSDRRIKSLYETIPDPLAVMKTIRGYSWYYEPYGTQGFGFMADEVEKNFPGAVKAVEGFDVTLPSGEVVKDVKGVDTYGVSAALHHEAILAMMKQIDELREEIKELKKGK